MLESPDLVCFDFPCLVVPAVGTTEEALRRASCRLGLAPGSAEPVHQLSHTLSWPGREARVAFRELLAGEAWADAAAAAFDDAFGATAARRGVTVAAGAAACAAQLRGLGIHICLTTDFSAATREAVLDVLDWTGLVAMLVSEDAIPTGSTASVVDVALERAGVDGTAAVVISGSCSGVAAGSRAGVGRIIGIPGAQADARDLRDAGATEISGLPQLASRWAAARLLPA